MISVKNVSTSETTRRSIFTIKASALDVVFDWILILQVYQCVRLALRSVTTRTVYSLSFSPHITKKITERLQRPRLQLLTVHRDSTELDPVDDGDHLTIQVAVPNGHPTTWANQIETNTLYTQLI
jgi:hypothetical protein